MSFVSTLGAFTTFKSIELYDKAFWFELVYPNGTDLATNFNDFSTTNNSMMLVGNIGSFTGGNTPLNTIPLIINQGNFRANIPNTNYNITFGNTSNANTQGAGNITFYDKGNKQWFVSGQEYPGNANVGQITRIFDNNGNLLQTYYDSATQKTPQKALFNTNNTYTILGYVKTTGVNVGRWILTNYNTNNSKNWTTEFSTTNTTPEMNLGDVTNPLKSLMVDNTGNLIIQTNYVDQIVGGTYFIKFNSNANTIINSRRLYRVVSNANVYPNITNSVLNKNSNEIYTVGRDRDLIGTIDTSYLINIDTSTGNIVWQKVASNLSQRLPMDFVSYQNNQILTIGRYNNAGSGNNQGLGNTLIVSAFYTSNGNIIWSRQIDFNGSGNFIANSTGTQFNINSFKTDKINYYVAGNVLINNQRYSGYAFKLPVNGNILGNGNYTLISNVTYGNLYMNYTNYSNYSISNGNLLIGNVNSFIRLNTTGANQTSITNNSNVNTNNIIFANIIQ